MLVVDSEDLCPNMHSSLNSMKDSITSDQEAEGLMKMASLRKKLTLLSNSTTAPVSLVFNRAVFEAREFLQEKADMLKKEFPATISQT